MEIERREDTGLRDRLENLTVALERLLVITENQSRSIETHQRWIDGHENAYHSLDKRVDGLSTAIGSWSSKIDSINITLTKKIEEANQILKSLVDTIAQVKGGWYLLTIIGTASVSVVSLVLTVLKILGKV